MVDAMEALHALQERAGLAAPEPKAMEIITEIKPPNFHDDWPEPIAEEAYHGIIGMAVRAIEPHSEADPVAILVSLLTFSGNAIGRKPYSMAGGDRHGTNLFAVLAGETAKGRKGSATGWPKYLLDAVDHPWTDDRLKGGMSSGEGLIWNVRDAIEQRQPLKEGKKLTGDFETVVVDPGVEDKRLLAYEPEFASVLKVMSRDNNTLSTQVRQAWDSGTLRTMTKNNPAVATSAHISILGHITKDELLRYLQDTEAANGFANRFLWIMVKRSKFLPEGGGKPDFRNVTQGFHEAIKKAKIIGELARDKQTREAWATVYPELSGDKAGLFGAVTARAEAQVLRLSVLYAALDGDIAIRLPHLAAALAVWEYAERSAKYLFGDAIGDPVADRIIESLRMFGRQSRTDINNIFKRHIPAARISQALNLLYELKRATFLREDTGGRPTEYWIPL